MAKCCMRNCYGTDIDDLRLRIKLRLPGWLIDFLLDLSKCVNSQSQKNGLSNFNELVIYAGKELFDKLDEKDRNGDYYDLETPDKLFKEGLEKIINDFDYLICNGGSKDISDLDDKYNNNDGKGGGNKYPPGLSDEDKDKIRNILDENNGYNDNKSDPNDTGNIIIIDGNGNGGNGSGSGNGGNGSGNGNGDGDGSGNGGNGGNGNGDGEGGGKGDDDDYFNNGKGKGDGEGNPIINIPNDEILNIDLTRKIYKCFDPVFHLENYVFSSNGNLLFLTNKRKQMCKRIHNEILLPIFKHYYGENAPATCQLRIAFVLGSLTDIREIVGGNVFSKHLQGEAVDFTMVGVDPQTLLADIKSGALKIRFGVLILVNGVHITLPSTFEGLEVEGVILSSPKKSRDSLEIEFI